MLTIFPPGVLADKLPAGQLAQLEGSGQIDLQHIVPVLDGELLTEVTALNARAVDQDVQAASQQLHSLGKALLPSGPVSQINGDAVAPEASFRKLLGNLQGGVAGAHHHDLASGLHQALSHSPAQAPVAPVTMAFRPVKSNSFNLFSSLIQSQRPVW